MGSCISASLPSENNKKEGESRGISLQGIPGTYMKGLENLASSLSRGNNTSVSSAKELYDGYIRCFINGGLFNQGNYLSPGKEYECCLPIYQDVNVIEERLNRPYSVVWAFPLKEL